MHNEQLSINDISRHSSSCQNLVGGAVKDVALEEADVALEVLEEDADVVVEVRKELDVEEQEEGGVAQGMV